MFYGGIARIREMYGRWRVNSAIEPDRTLAEAAAQLALHGSQAEVRLVWPVAPTFVRYRSECLAKPRPRPPTYTTFGLGLTCWFKDSPRRAYLVDTIVLALALAVELEGALDGSSRDEVCSFLLDPPTALPDARSALQKLVAAQGLHV